MEETSTCGWVVLHCGGGGEAGAQPGGPASSAVCRGGEMGSVIIGGADLSSKATE